MWITWVSGHCSLRTSHMGGPGERLDSWEDMTGCQREPGDLQIPIINIKQIIKLASEC